MISDSGTISEDSSILNFPAVAIRKSTEKIESIENGNTIITGLENIHCLIVSIIQFLTKIIQYQRLIMLKTSQIELLKLLLG